MRCCYNAVNFLTNIHKKYPIARPLGKLWGVFCGPPSDRYSASVPEIIYAASNHIGPHYNGTRLYLRRENKANRKHGIIILQARGVSTYIQKVIFYTSIISITQAKPTVCLQLIDMGPANMVDNIRTDLMGTLWMDFALANPSMEANAILHISYVYGSAGENRRRNLGSCSIYGWARS